MLLHFFSNAWHRADGLQGPFSSATFLFVAFCSYEVQ